jgi:aspartate-semialdehyde dehydrogenase
MKPSSKGFQVAVVGASSLLGKELVNVLEERAFPISRLVTFEADPDEPDLPIVDLRERSETTITEEDISETSLDFAFLASRSVGRPPAFLREVAMAEVAHCAVIDLSGSAHELAPGVMDIPSLGPVVPRPVVDQSGARPRFHISPHPATIVISSLLLRLARAFPLERAMGNVFCSASEFGPKAIEELQKQTVNLLSFHKVPEAVFGGQLAFNMLQRLGRGSGGLLNELETRVRGELREYLAGLTPVPALRLIQVPVFHSLAVSLYVETSRPAPPEALTKALAGAPIHVRRASQAAPSHVESAGNSDLLVDVIIPDADHPNGAWIWATVDNLRLAAVNAVEIAEGIYKTTRM